MLVPDEPDWQNNFQIARNDANLRVALLASIHCLDKQRVSTRIANVLSSVWAGSRPEFRGDTVLTLQRQRLSLVLVKPAGQS